MAEVIEIECERQRRRLKEAIQQIWRQWDLLTAAGCAEELLATFERHLDDLNNLPGV
jgi:hypothetical protein